MSPHWLHICSRIDSKILLITFKSLRSLAPDYITELPSPTTSKQPEVFWHEPANYSLPHAVTVKRTETVAVQVPQLWKKELANSGSLLYYPLLNLSVAV